MVYKGVFCRTNYLTCPLSHVSATKCQTAFVRDSLWAPPQCYHINGLFTVLSSILSSLHLPSVKYVIITLMLVWHQLPPVSCMSTTSLHHRHPNRNFSNNYDSHLKLYQNSPDSTVRPVRSYFSARTLSNSEDSIFSDEPAQFIVGFRLEAKDKIIITSSEEYKIKANSEVKIRLFGVNFNSSTNLLVGFTNVSPNNQKTFCSVKKSFPVTVEDQHTAFTTFSLAADQENNPYYLCYSSDDDTFLYASTKSWFRIYSEAPLVPIWLQIILICILLLMSGLFSGLNLGLMALDKNELQVIERCGTEQEKYYAKAITPVRKRGNYLLCTLLLGNVLVNSTLTIFLDDLTSGIFAVIVSTLSIVIFGEIIPQALCSRHGLAVGAKTIYITRLFMILTLPLSYPISILLDKILGEEIGNVYDRERLMEYIRVTKDYNHLGVDEMNIISGALKFKKIRVVDIMTPIDDVFMLPYDSVLNFDTMTLINNSGYSRIPIYENERGNVVAILHMKDLSLIDPDHNLPMKVVLDFYSHPLVYVFEDVPLDEMLNEFKQGKSHMALVRRVIDNGVTDPVYELIGVVTLEDVIEELIQAEINDETDVISDNRRKQKRKDVQSRSNYLDFIRSGFKKDPDDLECREHVIISPQLALATFRFLASSVEPFSINFISEEVLKVLMSKNIYFEAKGETRKPNIRDMSPENVLYMRDQPADYFIMLLEGRARIIVTKENQEYDAGPFCCFGIKALLPNTTTSASDRHNNLEVKLEEQRSRSYSQVDEIESNYVSSSPVNATAQEGNSLSLTQSLASESSFVPDFTLFCMEKTIYMKVTRHLYQMAIRTTVIEKQRTSSMDKSLTGVNSEIPELDTVKINMENPTVRQRNKSNQLLDNSKYRKISISTNLPDSSLLQDQLSLEFSNLDKIKDNHAFTYTDKNTKEHNLLQANLSLDNLPKRKSFPLESFLKRSDAVDLVVDESSTVSPSSESSTENNSKDNRKPAVKLNKNSNSTGKSGNGLLKVEGEFSTRKTKANDLDDERTSDETSHLI